MIHLPRVDDRVGCIDAQNSLAMLGLTKANSSTYNKLIDLPRPALGVVAVPCMTDPLSNLIDLALYPSLRTPCFQPKR